MGSRAWFEAVIGGTLANLTADSLLLGVEARLLLLGAVGARLCVGARLWSWNSCFLRSSCSQ